MDMKMRIIFYSLAIIFGILLIGSISIQDTSAMSPPNMMIHQDVESVKNCKVGQYDGDFSAGHYSLIIEKNESGICYMKTYYKTESYRGIGQNPVSEGLFRCEIPLEQLEKFNGWMDNDDRPLLSGTYLSCELTSPRHQTNQGIQPINVVCKTGLELIFKANDDPACVKPSTAEKLIQRGWTTVLLDDKKLETIIPTIENCQYSNTIIVIAITEAKVLSEIHSLILGEISVDDPFPDIDLHAYTEDGLHVGMDYLTKEYENQIPNAASSGDLMNGREWISLPSEINARFVVDSTDNLNFFSTNPSASMMSDGVEDFSLVGIFSDENCKRHNSPGFVQQIDSGEQLSYDYTVVENTDGTFSITFEKDEQFS